MRAQLTREVILIQPNEHLNINFISVSLYHFFSDTQVSQYSMFLYDKQTPLAVIEEREREEGLITSHHDVFNAEIFLSCSVNAAFS